MNSIDAALVRSILDYDPETGVLTWRARTDMRSQWNARFAGKVAGYRNSNGYLRIWINGRQINAHRIAWLWMTGEWPKKQIDHKDGNRANNRFDNLREATNAQNMANRPVQKNNACGVKGVCWANRRNKWRAQIHVKSKNIFLGHFDSIEDAASAYAMASEKLHGEFSRVA